MEGRVRSRVSAMIVMIAEVELGNEKMSMLIYAEDVMVISESACTLMRS